MDMLKQGYNFVKSNSYDTPNRCILFFNQLIPSSQIPISHTRSGTLGGINYVSIFIRDEDWRKKNIVLHEYGHVIQNLFGAVPPEAGGTHVLGVRYNPQLAFSEGWGHFFAAAATGNPGIDPSFNLSTNPPYSSSIVVPHSYTPVTQFEGSCDEVMVASMLWQMYTSSSSNYSYMQNSLKLSNGSHKPYNIFEFIKNHKLYYDPGNGTSYWIRAGQNLNIGSGILFVNNSTIQTTINSAANKNIIYVFQGRYLEDISISNKDLALFGEAPKNTIISSPNSLSTTVISINNSNSNSNNYSMINGFTISGGNFGIDVAPGSRAYISNNAIEFNKYGVKTQNEIILKNNSIRSNQNDGFSIPEGNSTYQVKIYNNVFDNNTVSAIHFYNTQGNLNGKVINNIFTKNGNGIISESNSINNAIDFS